MEMEMEMGRRRGMHILSVCMYLCMDEWMDGKAPFLEKRRERVSRVVVGKYCFLPSRLWCLNWGIRERGAVWSGSTLLFWGRTFATMSVLRLFFILVGFWGTAMLEGLRF